MNDYNRGALKEPCLRLDYGFGEQWASVELGDGTGYVRLSDYEKLKAENAKLREYAESYAKAVEGEGCGWCPYDIDATCGIETLPMHDGCKLYHELRVLRVKAR